MNKESSEKPLRSVPSIKVSLVLYGMTIVLATILGVVLVVSGNTSIRLGISLEFFVQWGFIFLPIVLVLRVWRYDIRKSLNLNVPERTPLIGILVLAPSSCIILHQMLAWQMSIFPMPDELNVLVEGVRDYGQTRTGLVFLLVVTAISPAICEEVLYRGILFSSLRRRLKPVPLTIVIALLFSLYHLHPYRIILVFLLGVLLTYVVLRTGSIYLSMLFHFIHNSLSLVFILGLNERLFPVIRYSEEKGFATTVVVISLLIFIVGVVILERYAKGRARGFK
ncbi:MAG: lysostaphin resistance A-like protein [Planctomycetota bacterium]